MDAITIVNNKERQRFETKVEGDFAYVDYRMQGEVMVLMHTFVPEKLRGRHLADELAKFALSYVEKENIPAKIYCPFITAFVQRHPEYIRWRDKLVKKV